MVSPRGVPAPRGPDQGGARHVPWLGEYGVAPSSSRPRDGVRSILLLRAGTGVEVMGPKGTGDAYELLWLDGFTDVEAEGAARPKDARLCWLGPKTLVVLCSGEADDLE